MMRSSLGKKEVIATFLSRINQLKFPLDASALFYQKARTIWRRNPAFPNQSLCAVFTSSLVISEAPSLAISYHKHSELRLWANRKYRFFMKRGCELRQSSCGIRTGSGKHLFPPQEDPTQLLHLSTTAMTKILLDTALLDISLEVSTSLESDGKAEKSCLF